MTATTRTHTLASIAADAQTTKRTVQRWLSKAGGIGELRGDTRYFSDAERDTLLTYQGKRPVTPVESVAPDDVATAQITVIEGNHRATLDTPVFPTEFNLGSMRSELATVEIHDDPLALAEQFINGADSLMDAMNADEQAMAQKIAQTRQARAAVGRKVDQLKRRHDIYSLRSEILADRQNVETTGLSDDFEVLQAMGKSGGAGDAQSQQ